MRKSLSKEEFVKKAQNVHGNKYDYSKVVYINNYTKVCIICPEHGEFWQIPAAHLRGQGCKMCSLSKPKTYQKNKPHTNTKKTTEQFIEEAQKVHGGKYDYSKIKYVNATTKVCIICPTHGEFWQNPSHHLQGCGCNKCSKRHNYTTDEFITRLKELYGNKYDYSKVEYINTNTPVCLICHEKDITGTEHGEFYPTPNNLLKGNYSCPKCIKKKKYTTEEWVQLMKEKYKNKGYNYSKVNYIDAYTKVCIICPKHGEFWQTPHSHDTGKGCPKCRTSTLETIMEKGLMKNNIKYIPQYKEIFKKNKSSKQSLDFYLPDYNIGIECQGLQHFLKKWYSTPEGKKLNEIEERDNRKRKICEDNKIKLIYLYNKKDEKFVPKNDGYKYFNDPQTLIDYITNVTNRTNKN